MSISSSVEQKHLSKIFSNIASFKNEVTEKELAYKAEIARLEAVVASLEAKKRELNDPMRSLFVETTSRTFALFSVPWGASTAKTEGGYIVFASDEARSRWYIDQTIKEYPGILDEKPENRKLLKVGSRYAAKKQAPWAKSIAKVKSGFIAFPSIESFWHWRLFSSGYEANPADFA